VDQQQIVAHAEEKVVRNRKDTTYFWFLTLFSPHPFFTPSSKRGRRGSAMRFLAIVVIAGSAAMYSIAAMTLMSGKGAPEDPNQFLPYAAGTLLIPTVLLIGGVWLWGKGGPKPPQPPVGRVG
jgi:uncharacterized membrane protein